MRNARGVRSLRGSESRYIGVKAFLLSILKRAFFVRFSTDRRLSFGEPVSAVGKVSLVSKIISFVGNTCGVYEKFYETAL